jgi:polysaccharide biosynthesis transport protein
MTPKDLSSNEPGNALRPVRQSTVDDPVISYSSRYASVSIDQRSASLSEYWRILAECKGMLFFAMLLGALTGILLTVLQVPVYRADTLLEVQNPNDDFLNMRSVSPTVSGSDIQSPEYMRTQAMVLQSKPVLERAIKRLHLENRLLASGKTAAWTLKPFAPHKQDLTLAEEGITAFPEPNTRVIKVSFDATEPRLAADFANLVADEFVQLTFETREQTSQDTVDWLMRQMASLKTKLGTAEEEFQGFAGSSKLTILSENENVDDERLRDVQVALSKAQTDTIATRSRYELALQAPRESLPEILDDATLKEYQLDLTTLRRQLAALMSEYTAGHPKVEQLQAQITVLEAAFEDKRNNVVARIKNDFLDAQRRESLLTSRYNAQTGHMAEQAQQMAHYLTLKREVDTTRALYNSMLQKVTEASVAAAMRTSNIHVIERATPPEIPFKPNLLLNMAFAIFTGLCLAIAVVIKRARSDRGINDPGDLSGHLNVLELGVIPAGGKNSYPIRRLLSSKLRRRTLTLDGNVAGRLELTTSQQQPSLIAESFRSTVASILFSKQNGLCPRLIALSSAGPQEGKTTVVSNLGIALAQTNQRVLLIDGDTRRPRLHEIFGGDNSVGLCDVLSGKASPALRETQIPNLFLLPSGHSDDKSLLFKPELPALLHRLKAEFDMVLIDTPPMLQIPDARLFGRQVDAVILVVAQHTHRHAVQAASQRLAEDGTVLLGTILNNWNPNHRSLRSLAYYYYDSYSEETAS